MRNTKIIYRIGVVLAVMLLIGIVVNMFSKPQRLNEGDNIEIARSMTYRQVEEGEEETDSEFVNFDAFFLRDLDGDGYAESIRGTCKEVGEEDTLYMELRVLTNGYLKDGKITINSDNFYFNTAIVKDAEIKNNYIGVNIKEIELNQVNNGTQKLLTGSVRSGNYLSETEKTIAIGNDTTKYSRVNSVTLTGIHVKENADGTTEESTIEKTVEFDVDWHGTTKTKIRNVSQEKNIQDIVNEENQEVNLQFTIQTQENNNQLILKKSYLEGTIPLLNGYEPTKVEITGSNITYSYNENTRKFIAQKEAVVNSEGIVTSQVHSRVSYGSRYNEYSLKVTYPIEAYEELGADTIEYRVPVKAYYEGFNNPNSEFTNPYRSNMAEDICIITFRNPKGTVAIFDITVERYPAGVYEISKEKPLKIYNGLSETETEDYYTVRWEGSTGTDGKTGKMTMKETENGKDRVSDQFIKSNNQTETMENMTTNIGIYFANPANMLGEDGEIKVYDDETGELLATFDKTNWSKYSESNPYKYEVPVKHLRIETSDVKPDSSLKIYHIKELDDEKITNRYTLGEFENLKYIRSTLAGYLGNEHVNTDIHQARYEEPKSSATVYVSKSAISTQETYKNLEIDIRTNTAGFNQVKWQNGAFLLKMPEDIIDIKINDVTINNTNVNIISYEQYEENGERFIKINTENEGLESYTITVNCDITPDPTVTTKSGIIELYAYNEANRYYTNPEQDIYDVNDDLNTEEKVHKSITSINLISPNSLLTSQTATNYDTKGSVTIAPQVALVAKEQRKARIHIGITNNYSSTISEVKILGKIPFEGNTYIINGSDMGSQFSVNMSNAGIILPEELQGIAKVYYSINEDVTNDLTDETNEWAEEPEDFTQVKSFLIDLGDKILDKGESQEVYYEIDMPTGINYNEKSFSHHSVYFSLDTENGKYRTQTEPNKLGFMIAKQYDLELTKYQKGTNKVVAGATYSVQDEEEVRTKVTAENGKLILKDLYVDKEYTIKEIKTPKEYELNEEEVTFVVREENGQIRVEVISGNTRNTSAIQGSEDESYKACIEVEDEVKANLKIVKVEQGTQNKIANVKYKLTGKGLPSAGRILTTDLNGEINLKGLYITQEYTLEELKAEGYYLANPIKFTITNNGGTYTADVTQGTLSTQIVATKEDEIPTLNLTLEDEKIPTYNLTIKKVEKGNEINLLAGAKFKLVKDGKEVGKYETTETGTVTISNLYAYEETKKIEQTYILQEVLAPEGYARIKDIEFKVTKNSDGTFILENTQGTIANTQIEGNNITITLEDSPSLKLIKKDEQTGDLLPNTKFVIYNVENGIEPARNSKGELLGTKEIIDGVEYNVVTTDENGKITASLPEGLYKAVEVKASHEKYALAQAVYFGIGKSREGLNMIKTKWASSVGGDNDDRITSIAKTKDGGYVAVGYFYKSNFEIGSYTLTNNGSSDGMIIKYNSNNEVEWATSIGGTSRDEINTVSATEDGGYVVAGEISGDVTIGESTITASKCSGIIVKYNSNNQVEWTIKPIDRGNMVISTILQTSDGGYIIGGGFLGTIELGTTEIESGRNDTGIIIKYDENHQYEWAAATKEAYVQITTIIESRYGGYIVGGNFEGILQFRDNLSNTVLDIEVETKGSKDGMIIKYNEEGILQKVVTIGGTSDDTINTITEATDGGYLVGGEFESVKITIDGETITNQDQSGSYSDGILIKYDNDLNVQWKTTINGEYHDAINSIAVTEDGGYVVSGYFTGDIQVGDYTLSAQSDEDIMLIKYNSVNEVEWVTSAGGDSRDIAYTVVEMGDDDYIIGGEFSSSTINVGEYELTNTQAPTYSQGMLIRYERKETPNISAKWVKQIGNTSEDAITSVELTEDGGYIAEGYFKSTSITIGDITLRRKTNPTSMQIKCDANNEVETAITIDNNKTGPLEVQTSDGGRIVGGSFTGVMKVGDYTLTSKGNTDGMLIKYNANNEVEWATSIGGPLADKINSVAETEDGGYLVGGSFTGTITIGDQEIRSKGNVDGMILKIVAEVGIPEQEEITVLNRIKDVKITTEVEELNGVKGGTISGEGEQPYEKVKYGETSTKEIKMTPESEYEITKITINGEIVEFEKQEDGSYTLPQFTNMLEDKHIVVTYIKKDQGRILVHHYIEGTEEKVAEDEEYYGKVDEDYRTYPKVDLAQYELIKDDSGEYVIPENATGKYKTELQEIIYYYRLKNVPLIVNHYIEGTTTPVPLASGDVAQTVTSHGNEGDPYITEAISQDLLNEKYELIEIPENSTGTYEYAIVEVTYYYRIKTNKIITRVESHIETNELGEEIQVPGGTITGENENPYETVEYGENSVKDIKATPDEGYQVKTITVNGEVVEFTENEDGTVDLEKFINMTEDKEVVVEFEKIPTKVIVHHYVYDKLTGEYTTNKVPLSDGKLAEDEEKIGAVGDIYASKEKENLEESYELYKIPSNASGVMTKDTIEVIYYYIQHIKEDITITKTWNHTNNIYGKPERVIVQLKNGDTVIQEAEITEENKVGEDVNTWTYTFTKLPKHDENGNEIQYTAGEKEVANEDLKYYSSTIDGLNITNTYIGPVINAQKTFTTEKGLSYVVEGEKITYYVTVTNEGQFAKDVAIKDNIPEGTTFVEGSIKVDGKSTYKDQDLSIKTATDLSNGITVNVPSSTKDSQEAEKVNGQIQLSFEVTVNELPEGTDTKQIKNIAAINKAPEKPETPDESTNEVTTIVNKSNVIFKKESVPESGTKVKAGDEITYKINVENIGLAPAKIKVKDSIPEGTTFIENSIIANGTTYSKQELEEGITLNLEAGEKIVVQFKVAVQDIENGAKIRNVATINKKPEDPTSPDTPTNETEHTYIEPIITSVKTTITENSKDYAIAGEKITYTVQVSNSGEVEKDVIVKDNIPEGTTFVTGSIKVDGKSTYKEQDLSTKTEEDLANGITVNVPKITNDIAGTVSVSFEVKVNKGVTGDITNTATVDDIPTNIEKTPIVTYQKIATVTTKSDETKDESQVTVGDKIIYTIRVNNTGTAKATNIKVQDNVPEGTKLVEIANNGLQEVNTITWSIDEIQPGTTAEVSFTVEVKYSKEEYAITNMATVDGERTNETENPYKKPEPELESTVEKIATNKKVTSKEGKVYYEIHFTAEANYFVGRAVVTMVDTLPYAIDPDKSELDGGIYNNETKTITWNDTIENIDTFTAGQAKQIGITKRITLKYLYENINSNTGSMINTVNSKIELQEPKTENPTEYEKVKEDEQEDDEEITIEIPATVIVHHYIYDPETNTYTTTPIAESETITGIIGQEYTTNSSDKIPANYECINEKPEKHSGKMTEEQIEVIYYYQLKETTITNEINKTAIANKVEKEYAVLTEEGGIISYTIKYKANISNYIGKTRIEIVDTLPAKIDLNKSNINGGAYDARKQTITWVEEIENINTYENKTGTHEGGIYTNEGYTKEITKQIQLVFIEQSPIEDLTNEVKGTTKVYYPEDHPTKPKEEKETVEATDEETVKQKYVANLKVVKQWDDNENEKQKRPESVKIEIKETQSGDTLEVILNQENNWTYEVEGLPKYDETGRKIEYEIIEKEVKVGDLEYYEEPTITKTEKQTTSEQEGIIKTQTQYTYTVTNTYKLLETDLNTQISKIGTGKITSSKQPVEYTIKFTSEIADYIGDGVVTIVDTLPYKIEEAKSNLNGGKYDEDKQTITWVEKLEHINTDKLGKNYKVDIEKQISVFYKDIEVEAEKFTNIVKGKIELTETEQKDERETTFDTEIDIKGTVIVKYVDIKTDEEIADRESATGKVGTSYVTYKKDIENYEYVKVEGNVRGNVTETETIIIYYYKTTKTKVIVEYVDEEGNRLTPDITINGKIGDDYDTEEKEFGGYELVKVPENKEGTMTSEEIKVTYIYKKVPAKVIVKYLEKGTETPLLPQDSIDGLVGDNYETQRKVVKGYKAAEPEPENSTGVMIKDETTNNTITVIYYYEKIPSGTLTVKYVDIDTKEEITYIETIEDENGEQQTQEKTYREEITGNVGDKYKTDAKDIPYYKLVKAPENAVGELTENGETVVYYYQKKAFNISVEKELQKVIFNGKEMNITNKKAMKIEIVASTIKQANLEITYAIRVKNTGELEGSAKVVENIPQGYSITSNIPTYWTKINDVTLGTTVDLKAGEEKTLLITLKWDNTQEYFGNGKNIVKVTDTSNPANFEETTLDDNESSAEIITSVKTGSDEKIILIVTLATLIFTAVLLVYIYIKK